MPDNNKTSIDLSKKSPKIVKGIVIANKKQEKIEDNTSLFLISPRVTAISFATKENLI